MSVLLPRLAAGALGTALALAVLGGPTTALAAPGPEVPGRSASTGPQLPTGAAGGAAAGRSAAAPAAAARPAVLPTRAAAARGERPATPGTGPARQKAARGTAARGTHGDPGPEAVRPARGRSAQAPGRAAVPRVKPAVPSAAAPADPRGNNGTFKVDGPVLDTSHGNEPRVACAFRLNFYGYDAGQLADISFTAVAPTSGPTTTVQGRQVVSTTAAKGGVYGGSYPVTGTWSAGDLGLDPTVRQHVKVSVESLNADGSEVPGGAKHKVFWLEPCAAAAVAGAPVTGSTSAPAAGEVASPASAPRSTATAQTPAGAAAQATPGSAVLSAGVTAQAAQRPAVVAAPALAAIVLPQGVGRTAQRPRALPFTGSPQLLALLLSGVVALAGGTALLVAVRRTA